MADYLPGRIRKARLELGLTQADLAGKLRLSEQTVANWEAGRVDSIRIANLRALSDLTGKPIRWFRP